MRVHQSTFAEEIIIIIPVAGNLLTMTILGDLMSPMGHPQALRGGPLEMEVHLITEVVAEILGAEAAEDLLLCSPMELVWVRQCSGARRARRSN